MRLLKKNFLLNIFREFLIDYPVPSNINYLWNFGVLAGICLVWQIISGIFLAMYYIPNADLAFISIEHIMRDVNNGWFLRYMHSNGASFFFIVVYIHMFRGLYYSSYIKPRQLLWMVGVFISLFMIITAFLGYVLPRGQMSFWAATVITNPFSVVPLVGNNIVIWLWGAFSVGNETLNRFYSFHYLLPFILVFLSLIHLILLHVNGSSNLLGVETIKENFISFNPLFTIKDFFGFVVSIIFILFFIFFMPNLLGHTDNYIQANPLVTPLHIVPEWYFLPFYAILRSIPNKAYGVIFLILAIVSLLVLPFITNMLFRISHYKFIYEFKIILFWFFFMICIISGWIGSKPIEYPFLEIGQIFTAFYFFYFILISDFVEIILQYLYVKYIFKGEYILNFNVLFFNK